MMTTMKMMTRPIYKIVCLIVLVTVGFSSIVAATTAAAESTTDNNNANKKNQAAASAGRILVRRPDSERQLAPPDRIRILNKEKEEMIFTRAYTVVTSPKDVTLVDPPTIQGR